MILLILIIESVFLFLYYVTKVKLKSDYRLLNPVNVLLIVWGLIIPLHNYFFGTHKYTAFTYIMIMLGVISFVVGFYITCRVIVTFREKKEIRRYEYKEVGLRKIIKILTIFEIANIGYSAYVMYKISGSFSALFNNGTYVRNIYLERTTSLIESLFTMFITLNTMVGLVAVGIYVAKRFKYNKIYMGIWLCFKFLSAVLTMSKLSFVLSLVVFFVAYLNNIDSVRIQKKVIRKALIPTGITIVLLLMIIGLQRNYTQFGGKLWKIVFDKALFYITSPTEALGIYISTHSSQLAFGTNTYAFIVRILTRLGIFSNAAVFEHGEAIYTDLGITNVYTWFRTFFLDYSYIGIIIQPLLFGVISGAVYKVRIHNLTMDVITAWFTGVITFSFYAYLFGQSTYILIFIYAFIFNGLTRRWIYTVSRGGMEKGK